MEIDYRERSPMQWRLEWEHAANQSKPLQEELIKIERQIEALLNALDVEEDVTALDKERSREVLNEILRGMYERPSVGSFILGHTEGWIEAVETYDKRLREVASSAQAGVLIWRMASLGALGLGALIGVVLWG